MARTLEQLVTLSAANLAEHRERIENARAQEESTLAAEKAAEAEVQRALIAGDEEAYAAAKQAVVYNHDKYDQLIRIPDIPFYTEEEWRALLAELSKALGTETAELFEQLEANFLAGVEIVNAIKQKYDENNRANTNLLAAIPYNHRSIEMPRGTNEGRYFIPLSNNKSLGSRIRDTYHTNSPLHKDINLYKESARAAANK